MHKRHILAEAASATKGGGAPRGATAHPLHHAEFALTAANDAQLPPPGPPEIAFAGRSNAGKSTAINALANQARLAFASKTPGRTQQINFFRLRSGALLADLPGYGYAAVPLTVKAHWQDFLARYVATRQSLIGLVLVVDARHGIAAPDQRLLTGFLPSGRPVLVLATKIDKLSIAARSEARRRIALAIDERFRVHAPRVSIVPFSALRRIGVEDAESVLAQWLAADGTEAPATNRSRKEKAPRSRGVPRGPKRPSQD